VQKIVLDKFAYCIGTSGMGKILDVKKSTVCSSIKMIKTEESVVQRIP
jgi:hypothetical protein